MLSCHPSAPSMIENGTYSGKTLQQYLDAEGPQVLGSFGMLFHPFPILIKLIDAAQPLSIQVHPSNFYAITTAEAISLMWESDTAKVSPLPRLRRRIRPIILIYLPRRTTRITRSLPVNRTIPWLRAIRIIR